MIVGRRKIIKFFVIASFIASFIILGLFFIYPGLINESLVRVVPEQKTKIFIDFSKKTELEEFLKSNKLDFEFTEEEKSADIILSRDKYDKLDVIDSVYDYYIPVTNFTSQVESLKKEEVSKVFRGEIKNWKELGGDDLGINNLILDTTETISAVNEFFGEDLSFKKESDLDNLLSAVSQNEGYFSFLPIDKVDSRVNSISVDNISPIKSEDYSNYFYKIDYFFQSNRKEVGEQSKIIENMKEYLSHYKKETVELVAVGDIMLSRNVGTRIRESGDDSLSFRNLYQLLSSADITFANLESPFFDQGSPVTDGMVFKAEPETIEGLKLAGIDLVSLANNHFGNQGRKGMVYTFDHLNNNGIGYFGAGNNYNEAHASVVIESNGRKFAFLSYNEVSPESYKATSEKAGLAWISGKEGDLEQMESDIKKAKEKNDFVVISFHWGTEYTPNPNKKQKVISRRAIEAGADIILAQHPHVVQAVEFIENKFIAYSLGNFVFDQMWSEETREGIVVKAYFRDNIVIDVDFIAIKIENFNQPRLATEKESDKIIKRIFSASELTQ